MSENFHPENHYCRFKHAVLLVLLLFISSWCCISLPAHAAPLDSCPCCIETSDSNQFANQFYFMDEVTGNLVRKDYETGTRGVVGHYDTDPMIRKIIDEKWIVRDSFFRRHNGTGNRFLVAYSLDDPTAFSIFDKNTKRWTNSNISNLKGNYQRIERVFPIDFLDGPLHRALFLTILRNGGEQKKESYDAYTWCFEPKTGGAQQRPIAESIDKYHYSPLYNYFFWVRDGQISFFDFQNKRTRNIQGGLSIGDGQHLGDWWYGSRYFFGLIENNKWSPSKLRILKLRPGNENFSVPDFFQGAEWKRFEPSMRSRSGTFHLILVGKQAFGHLGFNPQESNAKIKLYTLPHPLIGQDPKQIHGARLLFRGRNRFLAVLKPKADVYAIEVYRLRDRFEEDAGSPIRVWETELPEGRCEIEAMDHRMIVNAGGTGQRLGLLSITRKRVPEYYKISTFREEFR